MTYFIWLLRIIHIGAGIFWVGGVLIMAFFIGPTVSATAEAGQRFVGHLVGNLKFSNRMAAAAGATILAGAMLYWIDSAGFTSAWMKSGAGTGFTIGAIAALIGFGIGLGVGRITKEMGRLAMQIQGKPTSEQLAQLDALQKRQAMLSKYTAYALIISVIFMAIARYFVFQ